MSRAPRTEGERWSREQLAALRTRRYTPRALVAFLAASQRRANAERARRPVSARRMRLWLVLGAGAHVGVSVADERAERRGRAAAATGRGSSPTAARGSARPGPRGLAALPGTLGWWTLTGLMLDWHLGMLETEDGRPRELGPADAVTLTRAWTVPLAARGAGPVLCLVAWASDGLDGALARAGEPTRLGRDLEGLVDACFAAAALRGARRADTLPAWAVAGELARLAAGAAYATWVWFARIQAPDPAVARAGRQSTPLRVAGLVAAASGRRGAAGGLLAMGSAWSLAAVAGAVRAS